MPVFASEARLVHHGSWQDWKEWATDIKQNTERYVGLVRIPNDKNLGDDSARLEWLAESPEELETLIFKEPRKR